MTRTAWRIWPSQFEIIDKTCERDDGAVFPVTASLKGGAVGNICKSLLKSGLIEDVAHVLHVLDVPDEVCLARLRARNNSGDHPFVVTDAMFHEISGYFTEPAVDEGFTILRHGNAAEIPKAPAP